MISAQGAFVKPAGLYRNVISSANLALLPEANRYHLYVSYACPWASRCLTMLKLKGLDDIIGLSVVHPTFEKTHPDPSDDHVGWSFSTGSLPSTTNGFGSFSGEGATGDPINNCQYVRDLYEKSGLEANTRYSVPVLWDKKNGKIVSNESEDIMRMFNAEFSEWAKGPFASHDFYPEALRSQIDETNQWVYSGINQGVYKCGFAQSQAAYDAASAELEAALDKAEDILSKSRYLLGNMLTESDLRLFVTLARYDEVYIVFFKCNMKAIREYPNLRNYAREIYQLPNVHETVNMYHIKTHYFSSLPKLNHFAVVPRGSNTLADFSLPHNRGDM